jgi:hypothetical protein
MHKSIFDQAYYKDLLKKIQIKFILYFYEFCFVFYEFMSILKI